MDMAGCISLSIKWILYQDGHDEQKERGMKAIVFLNCCLLIFFCHFSLVLAQTQHGDGEIKNGKPVVFIDWEGADFDFIQKTIDFIEYAEDSGEVQINVRVTSTETETGGTEYTVLFTGQGDYEGDNDELRFSASQDKPENERQKELVDLIKMGLMRYVGKTPLSSRIAISLMDKVEPTAVEDKWNFWVFSLSSDVYFSGEESYKMGMCSGSFSAIRITPELKIRLSMSAFFEKSDFTIEDEVYKSESDSQNITGLIVKSISDHWSVGAYFSALSSTYSNIKLSLNPAPAIEYNVFPYSESTSRQFRILYRLNYKSVRYREETIYEKTYENLWQQALSVTFELKKNWGTVSTSLVGSNYFHAFSKNRFQLNGELSLRLIKGLNVNIYGRYSRIRDQLSLPREGLSIEEVLLQQKQLATSYTYYLSVGLSYTFGSLKSKVVNPRFGTGGRSISISF
jgi:hypothetical protein